MAEVRVSREGPTGGKKEDDISEEKDRVSDGRPKRGVPRTTFSLSDLKQGRGQQDRLSKHNLEIAMDELDELDQHNDFIHSATSAKSESATVSLFGRMREKQKSNPKSGGYLERSLSTSVSGKFSADDPYSTNSLADLQRSSVGLCAAEDLNIVAAADSAVSLQWLTEFSQKMIKLHKAKAMPTWQVNQNLEVTHWTDDLEILDEVVDASCGTLVVMDPEGSILSRCWCLYEMGLTLLRKGREALILVVSGKALLNVIT
eukprot:gene15665-21769_t